MTTIKNFPRRDFLAFLGGSTLAALLPSGCATFDSKNRTRPFPIKSLEPSIEDRLTALTDIEVQILIKEGDLINRQGLRFGTNNDFMAIVPNPGTSDSILAVNHESVHPLLNFKNETQSHDKIWVDQEMKSVGLSLLRLRQTSKGYEIVFDDSLNRRLDANTLIPFVAEHPIENSNTARGTLANCSGGVTPWGTILSCEENYGDFVGDRPIGRRTVRFTSKMNYQWSSHFDMPPEHYGWVVEVEPATGTAKKLTSLGRMAHEGATVTKAKNGKVVVYLGDDDNDQCLYKFISESDSSLETGTLYVANIEEGRWLPLKREIHPELEKAFKNQTELLIYTRDAAAMVGASKLDRPEDIEIDRDRGTAYVALTNNKPKNRPHGSILKIEELNEDFGSLEFKASTFILGGEESGFSSPDNLAIDRNGHLWMTTDVSGSNIGQTDYAFAGNNSLFFIPLHGPWAGLSVRVAIAPKDAEFTGPCFSPDGSSLFLSVQHPGETSQSLSALTSHWPEGGDTLPKSAVVILSGKTMDFLLGETFK